MNDLSDAISDYAGSEHFLFLDDAVKPHAEPLLQHWCDTVDTAPSSEALGASLEDLGRLDVPVRAKRAFPDLLRGFLEFAASTGRVPGADAWVPLVDDAEPGFLERLRDDGTVRGKTHRKPVADVGRNDPCPCGSGKKFKKCCWGLLT